MTTEDDQFGDYHIPAGSVVLSNLWCAEFHLTSGSLIHSFFILFYFYRRILRNPKVYPDPTRFNPDRFITGVKGGDVTTALAHLEAVYCPGRRICPGRFFAVQQTYITVATILSLLEIRPALDDKGNLIRVEPAFDMNLAKFARFFYCKAGEIADNYLQSHPLPFKCMIIPRGDHVQRLLDFAD